MAKKVEKKEIKNTNWESMTEKELRLELQRTILNVKSGKESNTSLIKKIKKEIARKLTLNK